MFIAMMKSISAQKLILILLLSIFFTENTKADETKEIYINKFFIDVYLIYKFPIKKNFLFGNLEINKPNISFSEIDQSLILNTNFKFVINKNSSEGTIAFKTFPTFNLTKQIVTIQKTSIENFSVSNATLNENSLKLINQLLLKNIEGLALYKFDKPTDAPKEIKIYENGILFKY